MELEISRAEAVFEHGQKVLGDEISRCERGGVRRGVRSMACAGADIFSGAGVDASAKIAVQRGDGDELGVIGGDKGAGNAGDARDVDCGTGGAK